MTTNDNPYRPPSSALFTNARHPKLKETSVLLVFLLPYLTGGYYVPYWYVTRRTALNDLAGHDAVRLWPCILGVGLQSLYVTLLFVRASGVAFPDAQAYETASLLTYSVVFLALAFRVKAILEDSYGQDLSVLWTLFFRIAYLQYKINEAIELGGSLPGALHAATREPDFDLSDVDAENFCPSCGAGYTARATSCPDCQTELWPRARVREELKRRTETEFDPSDSDLADPNPVLLCHMPDPVVAQWMVCELSDSGIWFYASPIEEPGAAPGARDLFVFPGDLERAKKILDKVGNR